MRLALGWLLLATFAALDAQATEIIEPGPRNSESVDYDDLRAEWLQSIAERFSADPDPDLAWTGLELAMNTLGARQYTGPLPPAPKTGAGRLMRYRFCHRNERCPGAYLQWLAAEPGNLFVMAQAELGDVDNIDLARATRYDDYFLEVRALAAKALARPGLTPPHRPENYESGFAINFAGDWPISASDLQSFYRQRMQELAQIRLLDRANQARLAKLLVAARRSPKAASYGARLGVLAATDPVDRERYCRLVMRDIAADTAIVALISDEDDTPAAREFHEALRTHNGIDAVDAVAAHLPPQWQPAPIDAARMARCVAGDDRDVLDGLYLQKLDDEIDSEE